MKKKASVVKRKDLSKNEDYKRINRIYKACLREYKKASELLKEAKERHLAAKKNNADKASVKVAAGSRKMAKNYKVMWRKLIKVSAAHLAEWLKIHEDYHGKTESTSPVADKKDKKKKNKKAKEKKKKATAPSTAEPPATDEKKSASVKPKTKKEKKKTKPKAQKEQSAETPVEKKVAKTTSRQKASASRSPVRKASSSKRATRKAPAAAKTATPRKSPVKSTGKKDNLKRIEGIGVGVEKVFNAAGITTFQQLAQTPPAKLQDILDKAGPHYKFAKPGTWPEQAQLAAAAKWDELKALQAALKGGVKK